ncbi:hypothetical protein GGR57DRAFT_451544 [Xylariaceae sp. FL1272]|nr:hypothetical protein GGR57DRAFT_451544 [Xylariaceae sp. FL1272]
MMIEILAIPRLSDEAERVFSCDRRTYRWDRALLTADKMTTPPTGHPLTGLK